MAESSGLKPRRGRRADEYPCGDSSSSFGTSESVAAEEEAAEKAARDAARLLEETGSEGESDLPSLRGVPFRTLDAPTGPRRDLFAEDARYSRWHAQSSLFDDIG